MKLKSILMALALMLLPALGKAQLAPVPLQASAAYEGSHVFSGLKVVNLCVTWHTQAARWLMIFDAAAVPSNGAVAPVWCQPLSSATSPADQGLCFNWGIGPIWNRTGVAAVVSTNAAGCSTLTVEGANDWFSGGQVLP